MTKPKSHPHKKDLDAIARAMRYDEEISSRATAVGDHGTLARSLGKYLTKEICEEADQSRLENLWIAIKQLINSDHYVSVPIRQDNESNLKGANWSYSFNRINEIIARAFCQPAYAPMRLDPYVFSDGVLDRDVSDEHRCGIFRAYSLAENESVNAVRRIIDDLLGELKGAAKSDLPMASTALKHMPDPDDLHGYVDAAWWALRAISRKELHPSKTREDIRAFVDGTQKPWQGKRWILFLGQANERDFDDLMALCLENLGEGRQSDMMIGEIARTHIHRGEYAEAEIALERLRERFSESAFAHLMHRYHMVRVYAERGRIEESDSRLSELQKDISALSEGELARLVDDENFALYGQHAMPLVWAINQSYGVDDQAKLRQGMVQMLGSCVKHDYADLVLGWVMVMGRQLEQQRMHKQAFILWLYLYDAATYLDHGNSVAWACTGLGRCALRLKKGGRYVSAIEGCFEKTLIRTERMPGVKCGVLVIYAWYRYLHGDKTVATQAIEEALSIAEAQKIDHYAAQAHVLNKVMKQVAEDQNVLDQIDEASGSKILEMIDPQGLLGSLRGSKCWHEWMDIQLGEIVRLHVKELRSHYGSEK